MESVVFGSSESSEVFLGRDFGHTCNYSDSIAAVIDQEIKSILDNGYAHCKALLTEHRDKLDAVAEYLIANEKMDGDQFKAMMEGQEIPQYRNTSLFTPAEKTEEE